MCHDLNKQSLQSTACFSKRHSHIALLQLGTQFLALTLSTTEHSHGGTVEPTAGSWPGSASPFDKRVLVPLGVTVEAPDIVLETEVDHGGQE